MDGSRQALFGTRMKAIVLCGLVLLLALAPSWAQERPLANYFRESWASRDGLPHNQVNAIAQTRDGYLWFGTWEGLVRYNGLEFHTFDRSNTPALQDSGVRSLHVAADGSVIIGTSRGGVTIKQGDRWKTLTVKDGLSQDEIMAALRDRKGRLWVGTESKGVDVVEGNHITHFETGNGLPSNVVYALLLDRDDSVWAATSNGLVHFFDGRSQRIPESAGLPQVPVFSLMQDSTGTLFVGTERGAYRRSGQAFVPVSAALPSDGVLSMSMDAAGSLWLGTVNKGLLRLGRSGVEEFGSQLGLPNNRVPALMVDREGSIWAGTNAGLLRLSDAPFTTWNRDHGMSDDYVRTLLETRDGSIWIGTSRGLNRWRSGKVDLAYTAADGLPSDSVLSLLEDRDGSLLVGTYTAGVLRLRGGKVVEQFDNAHGMPGSNYVRAIVQHPDGTLWFGTTRGLVRLRDGKFTMYGIADGLPREFIISLHLARDGSLWIGTANGVARIVDGRIQKLDMRGMNGAQDIFDFHEDADGSLWIASDRGLLRYNSGELQAIGLAQGLPVDTLFAVVDDGIGSLWLTSNRGVIRVTRSEALDVLTGARAMVSPDFFNEADGLASGQCNGGSGPAALRARNGRVWVATAGGAAMVDPKTLHSYRRTLPPVVIEQVLANDQVLPNDSSLQLPAGVNKLEFHYATVSSRMPRFVRYRYRLEGEDSDWVERGNMRVAQYTNLRPGHYRFLVNASLPGISRGWSKDITTLDVRIAPRFWQRVWFLPLLGLMAILCLIGGYRLRLGQLRQRSIALEAEIETRTTDLREQTERLRESDRDKSFLLSKLQEQSEAFERQAREDALTRLGNRRSMDETLGLAFSRAAGSGQPLSFALIDIDHFKLINDQFSHAAGDRALVELSRLMRTELGALGALARWGGEEFAVLFEGLALGEACRRIERLRWAVERMDCSAFAPGLRMTISGGVAERTGFTNYEKMVSRADALLYVAKHAGRNRIES